MKLRNEKVKVVMLPTKGRGAVAIDLATEDMEYVYNEDICQHEDYTHYHLYATINDKIKLGDWFITNDENRDLVKATEKDLEVLGESQRLGSKVLASTDKSMRIIVPGDVVRASNHRSKISRPIYQIPENFILSFVHSKGRITQAYVVVKEHVKKWSTVKLDKMEIPVMPLCAEYTPYEQPSNYIIIEPIYDRYIICSAVNFDGIIVSGRRHSTCWHTLEQLNPEMYKRMSREAVVDGFIDNYGDFHGRKEAWKIAEAAGQIRFGYDAVDPERLMLISENLFDDLPDHEGEK